MRTVRLASLLLACALPFGGCTLPRDGPTTSAIDNGGNAAAAAVPGGYKLIELNPAVVSELRAWRTADAAQPIEQLPPPRPIGLIGAGDLLKIVVWETGDNAGGLTDKPGLDLTARVEPGGDISLPFAGRMAAAGRTPAQVERNVVGILSHQVAAPQASVLVTEDQTNAVIVQGDVARPGRQALSPGAPMLRDVLSLTGGPRLPVGKEVVRVERGDATVSLPLLTIMAEASDNFRLGPGDRIVVQPLDLRFYAFGAVNGPGEHPFPESTPAPTLSQALGRVAGLQDNRSDPGGLYVFRNEPAALTARLTGSDHGSDMSQVVFHLRMDDPRAFFLANGFVVRPDDIIYVSNSPIADVAKVISLITGLGNIAATPRALGAVPY